jgi:hypothetical protein
MRMQLFTLISYLAFFSCVSFSQGLKKSDFKVGYIELAGSLDSVTAHLGKAIRIERLSAEWYGFTLCSYEKLNVWLNDDDDKIWAFDISDSLLMTCRGLKIGDSVKKLEDLYSKREWTERKFSRVGPWDDHFTDYNEASIYEYWPTENDAWYIIFFLKKEKVVKILFYIGVYE